jgi:cytochrome P450
LYTEEASFITTLTQRRRDPGAASDLLALLMSARDPESGEGTPVLEAQPSGMTDLQLRDEIMTMLIAGHETVACALEWTWYLLATDPAAEAKFHGELAAVLGGRTP